MVDKFGRRGLLLFANAGCAITWVAMTAGASAHAKNPNNAAGGNAVVAFIFLFNIIFSFGFTPLQALYPVEVLSFEMRAKGMAFSSFVMNLGKLSSVVLYSMVMANDTLHSHATKQLRLARVYAAHRLEDVYHLRNLGCYPDNCHLLFDPRDKGSHCKPDANPLLTFAKY